MNMLQQNLPQNPWMTMSASHNHRVMETVRLVMSSEKMVLEKQLTKKKGEARPIEVGMRKEETPQTVRQCLKMRVAFGNFIVLDREVS